MPEIMTGLRFMDIRIVFKKRTDEADPDYQYFEPVEAYQLAANIQSGDLSNAAEMWAQSDHYEILSSDLIVNALSNTRTDLTR